VDFELTGPNAVVTYGYFMYYPGIHMVNESKAKGKVGPVLN